MNQSKQTKTFGDWGKIAIAKHSHKILKHEPKVLKDKDPEELHQMRVGMRRLRSTIEGFAPALEIPKAVESKKIGKIAKTLGKLRDLDVLIETLSQLIVNLPEEEQKTLARISKIIEKKRKKALKAVRSTLKNSNYRDFSFEIAEWLEKPQYRPIAALDIEDVLPDLLSPQISKLLLHPGWFVKSSERDDPNTVEQILIDEGETLHDLRKEAKRSRYNLELFTEFYCNTYARYLQQIKQLQFGDE